MSTIKPYARTTYDGHTVDNLTKAALEEAARRLGYDLTLLQGSYNGTAVAASAGTHAGGGVVDLAPYDWARKVKVLREVGFAAWHRLPSQGPWGEHIHAVLIGDVEMAPAAARQVVAYRNGRNGLANNAVDSTWRPNPIPTFKMPAPGSRGPDVDAAITAIKKARKANPAAKHPAKAKRLNAALTWLKKIGARP